MSDGASIQRLLDIEAIKQLKARYFRMLDTKDWDGFGQVFRYAHLEVPEAEVVVDGRDAIVTSVSGFLVGTTTVHHGHMPEIEITGTDTARGVWAMFDYVEWPPPEPGARVGLQGFGHYVEEYVRQDGQWRISRSRLERLRVDALGGVMTVHDASPIYYDPYDADIDRDVQAVWRRMREDAPVYWNERYGFWAFSLFDDVWNAYHDTATFSSTHGVLLETLDQPIDMNMVIFMDPPEHDWMRKLVSRAFTPRRIADLEAHIVALVDDYLDPFVGTSGFDYVEQFGAELPPMVIGHMLGVPEADRDAVRHWFDDTLHRDTDNPLPSERAMAAMQSMYEYSTAMVAERRRQPGDDMISVLIDAEVDEDTGKRHLTDDELVMFVLLLAGAGVETVARFLSWTAVTLAEHPDERALLVADPALIPNAVEEILRYEAPSPVNGRYTLRPYSSNGIEVPAGSKVLLLNGSANRDAVEFSEPDRFDVRRQMKRHITFGYGAHFCLGAALARMEARVAIVGTLARFPEWEVDPAECVRVQTSSVRGFSSVPLHLP